MNADAKKKPKVYEGKGEAAPELLREFYPQDPKKKRKPPKGVLPEIGLSAAKASKLELTHFGGRVVV